MKYRVPAWWKPLADAARRRDRSSAMLCVPRGERFDRTLYAAHEAAYWRCVDALAVSDDAYTYDVPEEEQVQ